MTDWQVGLMVEQEAAKEWERLNADDPFEDALKNAAVELKACSAQLNKVEDYLLDAIAALKGTPMEDVVSSILNDLEDVHTDIRIMATKYERGCRE